MFTPLASTLFIMSLLSLLGCSPRPTELPVSLAGLHVEIAIEDITERGVGSSPYVRKSITAVLRHARGGKIEREDVSMEVNGMPMEFRVGTGNYYDRHPYYRLRDDAMVRVEPATEYRFTLVLPDGARHIVGTIRTPAALEPAQIDFPARRPKTADVIVGWRDLAEPATLVVFRSDLRKENDGTVVNEAGSANDPAALRREIGGGFFRRKSDQWRIPAVFLASQDGRSLSALGAEIRVAHETAALQSFAQGSTLRAERRLTLRMECTEQE
jgi:hypothetical protein